MAVAYDAFSDSGNEADPNWTHTPTGTPRAVIVWVALGTSASVTSVSYGGVGMTHVATVNHSTGETGKVAGYFLGASIPTGAQTVAVNIGGTTGRGWAVTLTASANTEVVDSDATINSDSVANPSVTLSLGGRTSWAGLAFISGQDAVNRITPLTSWTARVEVDNGTQTAAVYTYNTVGTADVTAGWTQDFGGGDDAAAVCVAVSEITGYTLACDSGSYSVTGATAAPLAQRKLSSDTGTYSITGAVAVLSKGFRLSVDAGVYALTGAAMTPLATRLLGAVAGSYSVAGQDAGLYYGRRFAADTGSYVLTGSATTLLKGYGLPAATGSYALTGAETALLAARKLTAETGSYLVTGQTAALLAARKLLADAGVYSHSGSTASVLATRLLEALAGVYTITGSAANLIGPSGYTLNADTGSYAITGSTAGLLASRLLSADAGVYTLTGQEAQVLASRLIAAVAGVYGVTGQTASLIATHILEAVAGQYLITGSTATLTQAGAIGEADEQHTVYVQAIPNAEVRRIPKAYVSRRDP